VTDKPRIGDPAPDNLFDPLDAAGFLLATADKDASGLTILSSADVREIQGCLDKARAERGPARAADLVPAPDGSRVLVAEYVEEMPGPGGNPILVKSIPTMDALEKLDKLGELTDRGLGLLRQAIEQIGDETRGRLDKAERAIGAVADEAGGRITALEDRADLYGRKILGLVQTRDALAKRLEEAEADHSRLQSRVIELEAQAGIQRGNSEAIERRFDGLEHRMEARLPFYDARTNRIEILETAMAELKSKLDQEQTFRRYHDELAKGLTSQAFQNMETAVAELQRRMEAAP
jgi:hypothetical protein